ncbi:MAG: ABC transporter substrate-binding protein [Bacillota bacterium]
MGNALTGRTILMAAGALSAAGLLALPWLVRGRAPPERDVIFMDQDAPIFRANFESFKRHLAALMTDPGLRFEYFVPGDLGPEFRARIARRLDEKPALVVTTSTGATRLVHELSPSTPIIFGSNADPVEAGLVADLNRPGGNSTGITQALPSFGKRIELLVEAVPSARRIGVLVDRDEDEAAFPEARDVAARLGVTLRFIGAMGGEESLRSAVFARGRDIDAWYVPYNGVSFFNSEAVIHTLDKARKPAMFERARFADMGGLMAYQHTVEDPGERFAVAAAQILRGVPPGEIPVVRPRRFELVINLATARRLGIDMPKPLVKAADRVIAE